MKTNEGAFQHEHSLDHLVEFFSKAGSLREMGNKKAYYDNQEDILRLFQSAWIVNKIDTMKLLLWLRDCRGGAGNRSGFRKCLVWLAKHNPEWVNANLPLIPEVGRWDDLRVLFDTPLKIEAAAFWASAINENNGLAAKWAKRKDRPIQRQMCLNIGNFRRYLAKKRKENAVIVESKMCSGSWKDIEYSKVPSVAMARYTTAFNKRDPEGFQSFKNRVKSGEEKINASVLFPHDCITTARYGDAQTAQLQFNALPNYIKTNEKIMVISDTSGSMSSLIGSGRTQAVDISMGLALYCSDRIGEGNPFYRKFIGFCDEAKFKDWTGLTLYQAINNRNVFDRAVGGTRIDTSLDLILNTAQFFGLTQEFMPTMLLIISDMQFHSSTGWSTAVYSDKTEVNMAMDRWNKCGYKTPKIVYWNVNGYAGSPETVDAQNTGLVSGFSPSILGAVLGCEDFTPRGIMYRALEKYHVNVPF